MAYAAGATGAFTSTGAILVLFILLVIISRTVLFGA
ncbi:sporulation protein YjcZ [Paenibacillus turpanensis]|nr:sporulation protein YjcZ [Paenibacillus turpanensis]